jgi:protein-S-isoprenylcysteine O-methyltransferase Ste14
MHTLELKVPPPAVAVLVAGTMWASAMALPAIESPELIRRTAAALIALTGVTFSIAGVISIRRARTTINPTKPETTTSLVCSGIYRITRNPMYLGLFFILVAWAVFLSSAWALLGPIAFVLYIGRFQIAPEERVLAGLFGADYAAYQTKVRRWL